MRLTVTLRRQRNEGRRLDCKQVDGFGACQGQHSLQQRVSRRWQHPAVSLRLLQKDHMLADRTSSCSLSKFAGAANSSDVVPEAQLKACVMRTSAALPTDPDDAPTAASERLYRWDACRKRRTLQTLFSSLPILPRLFSLGLTYLSTEDDAFNLMQFTAMGKGSVLALANGECSFLSLSYTTAHDLRLVPVVAGPQSIAIVADFSIVYSESPAEMPASLPKPD